MPESITPRPVARKTSLATGRIRDGLRVHALVGELAHPAPQPYRVWKAACGRDMPTSVAAHPGPFPYPLEREESAEVWLGRRRVVTCEKCLARMK